MKRRRFLSSAAAAGIAAGPAALSLFSPGMALAQQVATTLKTEDLFLAPDHPLQSAWQAWKALCLSPEGRVIDSYQNNVSHSEGQGYGLTMAAIFGDSAAAGHIISWTEQNLAVRNDHLLAWRWYPDRQPAVTDRNNASDGDLFYAWGLALMSLRSERPEYLSRASQICADLLRLCSLPHPDGSAGRLLLPGAAGFRDAGGITLNPSYYMPRAMRDLARLTGLPELAALADTGQQLVERLARSGPVPDWVRVSAGGLSLAGGNYAPRSGYEAVRVTLFQIWSGKADSAALRAATSAAAAAGTEGGTVTVWSLPDGAVLERSTHQGYAAVSALAACAQDGGFGSLMPAFSTEQPYYPATLHLMSLVAQATTYPRCVPI